MTIRNYKTTDYEQLKALYLDSSTYGGLFDEARDSADRLQKKIEADPDAILIAEQNDETVGTLSLIDDGRVAWLFRFAVQKNHPESLKALHDQALEILKNRGHSQVLVYTPVGNAELDNRYDTLGFTKGGNYTCYWKEI